MPPRGDVASKQTTETASSRLPKAVCHCAPTPAAVLGVVGGCSGAGNLSPTRVGNAGEAGQTEYVTLPAGTRKGELRAAGSGQRGIGPSTAKIVVGCHSELASAEAGAPFYVTNSPGLGSWAVGGC